MEQVSTLADLTIKNRAFYGIVFAEGKERSTAEFKNRMDDLGQLIGRRAAVVFPYARHLEACLGELVDKGGWTPEAQAVLALQGPFMVVLSKDFGLFHPLTDEWTICTAKFLRWDEHKRAGVPESIIQKIDNGFTIHRAIREMLDNKTIRRGSIIASPTSTFSN